MTDVMPWTSIAFRADQPYEFNTDGWYEQDAPRTIDLGAATDLKVCTDSLEEFLYRFWVGNELYFVQRGEPFTEPEVERYAEQLVSSG